MKFAFLIHPLCAETNYLLHFDNGSLQARWGSDPLGFCRAVHRALKTAGDEVTASFDPRTRVADDLTGLVSAAGAAAEGRLYEIPLDALEILDDPVRAMSHMEEAVQMAVDWGAELVGLGSMTGVIGGQGQYLADSGRVAVTTGNTLTVYAALENVYTICRELGLDLSRETVAVIGVPGSIATAAATALADKVGRLLLVGRRTTGRAMHVAEQLNAEFLQSIPAALERARIVVSATSTGDCIQQSMLRPGTIVVDVAIPTDVCGVEAERDDVLILSGGLAKIPDTMARDSKYLWFHHGMIPSCLGETMVLALEGRAECFSLGRNLSVERVEEIGLLAKKHGLDFTQLCSFGLPLSDQTLTEFRKAVFRQHRVCTTQPTHGRNGGSDAAPHAPVTSLAPDTLAMSLAPTAADLAARAADLYARHINPVLAAIGGKDGFVRTFVRGEGMHLYDADGREHLDFVAGFGSVNLGHNHPAVVGAVSEALTSQAPGFAQSSVNPYAAALAERLVSVTPPGLEMVTYANSGTEAVEAALKLARKATGREGLLYCDRSFHGKSLGSLSVTGNAKYQQPFGPLVPGCESVPYGDVQQLDRALSSRRFAAFIVEPLQAEAGMYCPPESYLRDAQALCHKHGALLIVDEVQTGLGRTGKMFAVDHYDVQPDIMTLAKSLGGGIAPIGAMLTRRELWLRAYGHIDTFALHTSTFAGGSLACAAGLATLGALEAEDLVENAAARGEQLLSGLQRLCRECAILREVRGQGLLVGLEFEPLPEPVLGAWKSMDETGMAPFLVPGLDEMIRNIAPVYAMQVLLDEYGVYTQVARSNPRVLRIQPPLCVSAAEIDHFLDCLERVCGEWELSTHFMLSVLSKSRIGRHLASERNGDATLAGGLA